MSKKLVFLLFFIFVSFSSYPLQLKVIEVIDGDTVKLSNGKLLRYIGIDTPETMLKRKGKFFYSPQSYSSPAKEFNRRLVENKYVSLEFDVEKTDHYGRLLGYCFVAGDSSETIEGIFVNAKLVEEGLAIIHTKPPNVKYVDYFIKLQRKAREEKKGLWGIYETIDATQAHHFINQIRTVRGKVLNVSTSPKAIFLNFGFDFRKDFTIVIFKNSFSYFYNKGIDPLTFYKHKTVEVAGRIREYNGPQIIVNIPDEIEIIGDK